MLVKNWMSREVVTVDSEDSMETAVKRMKENRIRLLPVLMKRDVLVGVVSDGDIKRASASDATSLDVHELIYLLGRLKVKDIMTRDPITVRWDHTVEETAEILLEHKIPGVPVLGPEGRLAGVITQSDIFRVLISLTGVGKRGIQFALRIEDQPGTIKTAADAIRSHGGRLVSILTSYEGVTKGYRKVYLRAFSVRRPELEQLLQTLGDMGQLLYMVDHLEDRRILFNV
jgi:acetoin utilization protein AcuB